MNNPTVDTFKVAQDHIFTLMYHDCFPRFIKSKHYKQLLKRHWPRINARHTTSSPTCLVSFHIQSSAPFYTPDACSHETHTGSRYFYLSTQVTALLSITRWQHSTRLIVFQCAIYHGSRQSQQGLSVQVKSKKVIWIGSFGLHLMCSLTSYVIWKGGTFLWKLPDRNIIYC